MLRVAALVAERALVFRSARAATVYLMEPGSLIMDRKMLIGIKQWAEHLATEATAAVVHR